MEKDITSKNLRIAILTSGITFRYDELIWKSLKKNAVNNNIHITFFVGQSLKSPHGSEIKHNAIYDQINPLLFDGLILVSGVLANYVSLDEYKNFLHRFLNIPKISLSIKINNIPSILIDNKKGIKDCVSHLIIEHGYKRIAFLKGPDGQQEADERYKAYLETLKDNNIEFDPELILKGDFTRKNGQSEVNRILDEKNIKIDAIVCANDEMAIGVYAALEGRGIKIPDQIAITGFDNLEICSDLYPPLSTITQPFELQAQKAIETIISIINGKTICDDIIIPTQFIIRKSCGCFNQPIVDIDSLRVEKKLVSDFSETEITQVFSNIRLELHLSVDSTSGIHDVFNKTGIKLINFFIDDLNNIDSPGKFIRYLDLLLSDQDFSEDYLLNWQILMSIFHKNIINYYQDPRLIPRAESIMQRAMPIIGELIKRTNNFKNFQEREYFSSMNRMARELVTTFDIQELIPLIQKAVSAAKIKTIYLCFYEKVGNRPSKKSKLMLAINDNKPIEIKEDFLFNSNDLLPGDLFSATKYNIVKPLFFKNDYFGYIILEDNSEYGFIYESIRGQLSSALGGSWQLKKREIAEKELTKTIENLKKTQEKLVESQKMAALGTLVSGIAHEMNTPLGVCTTASSYLAGELESIQTLFKNKQLKQSDFENFFNCCQESTNLINTNIEKASNLVSKFKEISVDKTSIERKVINISQFLKEFALSSYDILHKINSKLEIVCHEGIEINSYPVEFYTIFSNLLSNSLIHGFDNEKEKKILIKVEKENFDLRITYSDNGKGIKKEIIDKIFDPFFTTNRTKGGPGLGLHIVYNIVTQILGGTIECSSLRGNGVVFNIRIPVD
ncbi:MAG: substrate-binding domain-containing protein [Spirochaetaceae bacterium]|nr:substrate-binding domain-containing protein [Spirochaetaceae bacterium]